MHRISVRGVIIDDEQKLFLSRLQRQGFYCLPGGGLEDGETLQECLYREIREELVVEAVIGPMLAVYEFRTKDDILCMDFWFLIENYADFADVDTTQASHGYENDQVGFYAQDELRDKDVRPDDVRSVLDRTMQVRIV